MIDNRTEAIKIFNMMWPSDVKLTNEQYESVVDIIECLANEYKHKLTAKVKQQEG